jgi:hypothetical protein
MDHKQITAQALIDNLDNDGWYSTLFDEMYFEQSFSARRLWNLTQVYADQKCFVITDEAEFDYEAYFWELYTNAEKGLS